MMHAKSLIVSVVMLVALVGCAPDARVPAVEERDPIEVAAQQIADRLSMPLSGDARSHEETLSATDNKTAWDYMQTACEQGGYDLTPYANKRVTFHGFDTTDRTGVGHRTLWLMSHEGRIIGAYIASEGAVPGISGVGKQID